MATQIVVGALETRLEGSPFAAAATAAAATHKPPSSAPSETSFSAP